MYLSFSGSQLKENNILRTEFVFTPQSFMFCQNLFGGIIICEKVAQRDWKYFQRNKSY